ncbi:MULTISPECIES: hypothetical protein [unclassified Caballeronia]|uniref:hypothetical protein n=1 Tax=unclassified Caballeronia TaxID=2646786 RepID=UPI00285E9666|nr:MULTISPECIES: hypothetical protein [unclassified Caballeronia]MDR5776958.1 hypothetical protein [Caballeronia sp. LZ002]MDR5852390.1 hypothetical protein [Caballeronia sp. LZ003]
MYFAFQHTDSTRNIGSHVFVAFLDYRPQMFQLAANDADSRRDLIRLTKLSGFITRKRL